MKTILNIGTESLVMLLCGLLIFSPQLAFAQAPVASGATKTEVTEARNGVPVVNIAPPSASGLSHNTFTSYNVDTKGLVLNNGDTSQQFRQSQLAGQVAGNQNLAVGNQARIILNEVTGNSRSLLAGFTEVLGGKADIIVANPFGITSNGAGFINTDRVSLVTGTPNIASGVLNGFNVNGGDILITGTGLNASAQQLLDLVSRKITVGGQVNAKTLNLIAGRNNWDYATGAATALASGDGRPAYGIDSSALGGMYAGRISLKSTENGVGVRLLGNAAATADDFSITSDGKIELRSQLSAARDLSMTSTIAGADAIKATDASLTAGRNLTLAASNGGGTLVGGSIVAGETLSYNFNHLSDTGSGSFGSSDTNKRYGANINLTGTGNWLFDGVSYSSGSNLSLISGNLSLGATLETSMSADTDLSLRAANLTLSNIALNAGGDLALTSTAGALNFSSAQTQLKSRTGDMRLTAATGLDNAVTLTADGGDVIIRADGTVVNSGVIHAAGALDISDLGGGSTETLTNTGNLLGGTVAVKARSLNVSGGGSLESAGDMNLDISQGITIGSLSDSTSRILATTSGVGTASITAGTLVDNYGVLHSVGNLNLSAADTINNNLTGAISALKTLSLVTTVPGNEQGLINDGAIYAGQRLSASGEAIFNSGTMDSDGDMELTAISPYVAASFENTGRINAAGDIIITAPIFLNSSQIVAGQTSSTLTIQSFDFGNNTGLLSAGTITLTGSGGTSTFNNNGTISAGTLNATGFGLTNNGSPSLPSTKPLSVTATVFPGLSLTLPTNPNGKFVTSQNPNSDYLVESNPLYINIDNFLGSDYLAEKYGLDGDELVKRLGDAAYETYLVRQQLIAQAGNNFLTGYANEKEQMRGLMDQAGSQAATLGLTYGQALTTTQQANLTGDMVWMVETTVNGQKVLAPVVYLAASTRELFMPGTGVIAADKINMDLNSLTNTGGTISGTSLNVKTKGDIKNVSGTIKGGEVSLTSTEGNIINQTEVQRVSGSNDRKIGKQASIESTGTLKVDAAKDITNLGAKMSAGGEASLEAGRNVTFDTVEETTYSGSRTSGGNIFVRTSTTESTRSTKQVKSELTSGGNLSIKAKNDITLAGTDVEAKGNAALDAGGDINIIARENTSSTNKTTTKKGLFVSGGLYGTEKLTTDTFSSKNVGTSIKAGKDISLDSGKTVLLQGSEVQAADNIDVFAEDVKVLAGKDVNRVTTRKESTSILSISLLGERSYKAKAGADAAAEAEAAAGNRVAKAGARAGAKAEASGSRPSSEDAAAGLKPTGNSDSDAKAGADASVGITSKVGVAAKLNAKVGAEFEGDLELFGVDVKKDTTSTKVDETTKAVGSTFGAGKNIRITARKKVILEGAKIDAKGDIELSGQDVDIMAAEDKHTVSSTTSTTKGGVYFSKDFKVKVDADSKREYAVGTDGVKVEEKVGLSGGYGSTETTDVFRTKTIGVVTTDTTNVGSNLTSGGDLRINSSNKLTVQGSDIKGGQDVEIKAKNMEFLAGKDSHKTEMTTSDIRAGAYVGGYNEASAEVGAGGSVSGTGAKAEVKAEAKVEIKAGMGVQGKVTFTKKTKSNSKARVSTITSGSGSITRAAENSITDVGTDIEAAGDFNQSSKTFTSKAAKDTSTKTSSSTTNSAKLGIYAGAAASANVEAGVDTSDVPEAPDAGAKAKITAGVNASYSGELSNETETSTTAVVSSIKSGGKVKSVTTEKTSMEGTLIDAGKGVELEAGSLDYSAARDTTAKTSTSGSVNASAELGVGVDATKAVAVDVELAGDFKGKTTSEVTSSAAAGGIISGGDISIKTKGNTRLEGTSLTSAGDTSLAAGGDLVFDAARDTAKSSELNLDANASLTTTKGKNALGVGAKAGGGFKSESAESSDAKVGSVNTGGKLNISAGKTASFEGTTIDAGGDATISGKDGVTMSAAKSTSSKKSTEVGVKVNLSGANKTKDSETTKERKIGGSLKVEIGSENKSNTAGGVVNSGGTLKIVSGKDVTLVGTELSAGNKASIQAGGSVSLKAAESTSDSQSFGLNLSGEAKGKTTTKAPGSKSDGTKSPSSTAKSTPAKSKTPGTGGTQGSDGSKKNDKALSKWQKKQSALLNELKEKKAIGTKNKTTGTETTVPNSSATPKTEEVGPQKETGNKEKFGLEIKTEKSTTRTGGSIKAGVGGVEITAGGGDVNMEGAKIETSGDANISAKKDVNITAVKSTESSVGLSLRAEAEQKNKTPSLGENAKDAKSAETKPETSGKGAKAKTSDSPDDKKPKKDGPIGPKGHMGLHIDSVTTGNQKSEINTGGKLNISSGGKTSLTDTKVKAAGGEDIQAGGGSDRKTQ